MSRGWHAPFTLGWLFVVSSCNALFGIEEPYLVSKGAGGESTGLGGSGGASAGEGGESPGGTDGAGGAFGGSDGGSFDGTAGVGENVGGSAGELDSPGGAPGASGGSGTTTSGAAGEATWTGGTSGTGGTGGTAAVAGAAGTGGVAPCSDEESSCANATQVKRCEAGQWVLDDCDYGCLLDECSECEPGTIVCQGVSALQRCDQNGHYEPVESCGAQLCTTLGCRDCVPESSRCNSENGDAETCTGGTWVLSEQCEPQEETCVIASGESLCRHNALRDYGPGEAFDELTDVAPDVLRVFPLGELKDTSRLVYFALFGEGGPSAVARLVLYADQSGRPGAMVAASENVGINEPGPNTASPLQTTVLQAGTSYWIGAVVASTGDPRLGFLDNLSAPQGYELPLQFGQEFPAQFPTSANSIFNSEFNLFLQIRTQTP
jgi:hypothetical protein